MNKIVQIYNLLHSCYGFQGWWPLTEKGKIMPKYLGKTPNTDEERFEIIVGAILTQNTSWKNVEKAIVELNKANLISIDGILNCKEEKLVQIIKSAGYYNQKASTLKRVAEFLKSNKIQHLKELGILELRKKLLGIKGVGKETADSIILYAFEKPIFVVDAYTKRLVQRLALSKSLDYEDIQELFEKNLPKDVEMYKEYHALIVEHAKRHCMKKPNCKGCVLIKFCKLNNF